MLNKTESVLCRLMPPCLTHHSEERMHVLSPLSALQRGTEGTAVCSGSVGVGCGMGPRECISYLEAEPRLRPHSEDQLLAQAWLLCQIPHSPGLLLNPDKEFSCPSAHPTLSCPSAHPTHQVHPSCSGSDPALSGLRSFRAPPTEEGAGLPKKPFQHLRIRGEL